MKTRGIPSLGLLVLLVACTGCHQKPEPESKSSPRPDPQVAGDVEATLHAETALSGQEIQVAVNNGVVTLSGTAADPAARALASHDAGSVAGVRTVVNNLEIQPQQLAAAAPRSAEQPRERRRSTAAPETQPGPPETAAPSADASDIANAADAPAPAPLPASPQPTSAGAARPAALPPQPPEKTVVLETGTVIPIRLVEPLDSASSTPDEGFHATLASDLIADNMIAAPQGTPVLGRVVDARDAAHFKGNSLLSIELTRIDLRGDHIAVVTDTYSKQGAGRGRDTAAKVGGGAVLGSVIGALAGGGKGVAIGAIAGAGAGTGVSAATRGQQVQLPSESLISFKLESPITVTTSRAVGSPPLPSHGPEEPVLQHPGQP